MTSNLPEPMLRAFAKAEKAAQRGEVPVGAVITDKLGNILAAAGNRTLADHDPTAHGEMLAIREVASNLGSERLIDCDLYVTLEPCAMCAAAISFARIRRLYFAASDEKMGAVEHGPVYFSQPTCHHKPEVYGGIGGQRAETLLRDFFRTKR
jgi:tRNA(Arg) A34 adenosine deaminase TadA